MPTVPDKNVNFMVYDSDTSALYGIAEVTLPDFEAMSESMSGAGIAGEAEIPVIGHFGSMSMTLQWRTVQKEALKLMTQEAHSLTLRGVWQAYDSGSGTLKTSNLKIAVQAIPKNFTMGALNVGNSSDSESEFELVYIKITIDDIDYVELDKYSYIFKVNGTDYLQSVRKGLGLAS